MNAEMTLLTKLQAIFVPRDGPRDYFPVSTYGFISMVDKQDTLNYLPRSLAHLFLGDENRHKEVQKFQRNFELSGTSN